MFYPPVLMILMLLSFSSFGAGLDGPIVQTLYGPVRGLNVDQGKVFLGIPFAAPPVKHLRWKPPQPPHPWGPAVYNATRRSPACLQHRCGRHDPDPKAQCPPKEAEIQNHDNRRSENCLYLNVFTPHTCTANKSRKPVIIFIHGGNFNTGSAMGLMYDSRFLANNTDTIVVAANHRLGSLGFLKAGTGKDAAVGNYGIMDQIAAMQWVQDNIANFGGDENQVTLYGESSGAYSVLIHMVASKSEKLFHRAIVSSPPTSLYFRNKVEAIIYGDDFTRLLNCTLGDMACLRSATEHNIRAAQNKVEKELVNPFRLTELFEPWGPIIDDDIITLQMVESFATGHFQKKPLMIGSNTGEGFLFVYDAFVSPVCTLEYDLILTGFFQASTLSVTHEYPPSCGKDERPTLSWLITHFLFTCSIRNVVRSALSHGDQDMWLYVLGHPLSFSEAWGNETVCYNRVCHGTDLVFTFQTAVLKGYHFTPEEQLLADSFAYYFSNFAYNGDPNNVARRDKNHTAVNSFTHWPKYSPTEEYPNLLFDVPQNVIQHDYLKSRCDFWDKINFYPRSNTTDVTVV